MYLTVDLIRQFDRAPARCRLIRPRAWTGGSGPVPFDAMAREVQDYVLALYRDQVDQFRSYWGRDPDLDTGSIFWGRALADGWATFRPYDEELAVAMVSFLRYRPAGLPP